MEENIELIKKILPNLDEMTISRALRETGDVGKAVKKLLNQNSMNRTQKKITKRIVVMVHSDCDYHVFDGINETIKTIRSISVERSEFAPNNSIAVSIQDDPCKPLSFVEPNNLSPSYCQNLEPHTFLLTQHYDRNDIRVSCSLNSVILLPFNQQNVALALRHVFIENGIIGDGYGTKLYGDLWKEMLRLIPLISGSYADIISSEIHNPYNVVNNCPTQLISKSGNRIPQRILDTLKLFYSSDDPNDRLETGPKKRNTY